MSNHDGWEKLGTERIVRKDSIPCFHVHLDKLYRHDFLMKNEPPC
jgi:hypothetical protein